MNKEYLSKSHNFSIAFEQICSIIAIGKTKEVNETLKELILQTLVLLKEEKFADEKNLAKAMNSLFGLSIEKHEIAFSLTQLINSGIIVKNSEGFLNLTVEQSKIIQKRIDYAYELEIRVRDNWKAELDEKYPEIDFASVWKVLKKYLAKAFQRHGIQTVALLDPRIEINREYTDSLSTILDEVIKNDFHEEQISQVRNIISSFMATTGNFPDRSIFISQLADGAFIYFSLTIDPEIANKFRQNLNQLDLFLDTNFIYGILDLAVSPQVAVSNELLKAIEKYDLPFKLFCHERTISELLASVSRYEQMFAGRNYSKKMSRVATLTRNLSGVEQKYHQKFMETGIDTGTFFAPFHHADALLADKHINIFSAKENRLKQRSDLITEYTDFLKARNKWKSYSRIDHDMSLLDEVRQRRSVIKSTLDAGSLLITCDYSLYRFDWENSKKLGLRPCTVLPNLFWQILRPFIPNDVDFDRSFAETFAIPEFRIMGSNAAEACSKMLSILASFENFPEATAIKLLSNDLLIEQLQQTENDEQFQKMVEDAIVHENEDLIEEKELLVSSLALEKTNTLEVMDKLDKETQLRKEADEEIKSKNGSLDVAEKKINKQRVEIKTLIQIIISISISIILFLVFQFIVGPHWLWLRNHKNTIGLHILIYLLMVSIPALIIKKWRKGVFVILIVQIIFSIIQLVD